MARRVSARSVSLLLVVSWFVAPCPAQGYPLHRPGGTAPGETVGWAVAIVGDVNSDGFGDFVVGAPGATVAGNPNAGTATVYSGASGSVLRSFGGSECCGMFGAALAGVGDVDGDGVPDLAVGASETQVGGTLTVFSGATGAVLHELSSSTIQGQLGFSVATAGDVDNDGRADFIVGSPQARPGGLVQAGTATVYSGRDGSVLRSFSGPVAFDHFGYAVGGGKDVDGDGVPDLVVGAVQPGNFPTLPPSTGYVRVFSGATGALIRTHEGSVRGDTFGGAVALIDDLNGDGRAEVLVGAPTALGQFGAAKVFSGATGATLVNLHGGPPADHLGFAVAAAGDVDGNGTSDYVISSPGWGNGGRAQVFSGLAASVLLAVSSPNLGDNLGYSVGADGDLDGDGIPDLVVGLPFADPGVVSAAGEALALSYVGIPPGSARFGAGCPGTSGAIPRSSTAGGEPRSSGNAAFALHLSRARSGTSTFVLLGVSNTTWAGIQLPWSLAPLGLPLCSLLVSGEVVLPRTTSAAGRAVLALPVPALPALAGQSIFAQWYVVDPGPLPLPAALTDGLQLTFL